MKANSTINTLDFSRFLDRYYLKEERKSIINLLKDLGIYKGVESIINDYEFYTDSVLNIAQLSITVTNFITIVNKRLAVVEDDKEAIVEIIGRLGVYLINETFTNSKLSREVYYNTLKFSLQKAYINNNWNFEVLDSILKLNEQSIVEVDISSSDNSAIILRKPTYFEWNSQHITKGLFLKEVSKVFKIKSKQDDLLALFDSLNTDFKIILHPDYLEAFIMLFYTLYQQKNITVKGNKGYLNYIEKHLIPPAKQVFPKRAFKKIREECSSNTEKLKAAETIIKPILDKLI